MMPRMGLPRFGTRRAGPAGGWHVDPDGRVVSESNKEYQLFYECVSAAREKGYEPLAKILLSPRR